MMGRDGDDGKGWRDEERNGLDGEAAAARKGWRGSGETPESKRDGDGQGRDEAAMGKEGMERRRGEMCSFKMGAG